MHTNTALGLLGLLLLATGPGASAATTMSDIDTPVCAGEASGNLPAGAAPYSAGQDPTAGVKVWVGPNGMYVGICGHS